MNLLTYQEKARSSAIYLDIENSAMIYPALGLVGECGEVVEKIKKLIRDDGWDMKPNRADAIAKELGDCCWYLANICCDTNLYIHMIYEMRNTSMSHKVKLLALPQLAIYLMRYASATADILENWYYKYNRHPISSYNFVDLPQHLSHTMTCIEEIGRRCGFTLEDIYIMNIEKLSERKAKGTLKGEGDDR